MTELQRFRETVETFLAERKITATRFGKEFAGDPLFVFQLRAGREPREATRDKVLAGMSAASEQAA